MGPEMFMQWKQTKMNKKPVEDEAIIEAKEVAHAAGRNTGRSGQDDLVRLAFPTPPKSNSYTFFPTECWRLHGIKSTWNWVVHG